MLLSTTFDDYKNKQLFTNTKILTNNTNMIHKKIAKGFTMWYFVPLGPTLIFTTEKLSKPEQQNPDKYLVKIFISLTKQMQGIIPISLCAPWNKTHPHNIKPTYLNHQNQ